MYYKETQLVTISFPREAHLYKKYLDDKEWREIGKSTVGATFEKVVKEGFINVKENTDGTTSN